MAAVAVLVLGGGLWVILRILRKKKKQA
jgi:hypothetical protein